MVLTSERAKELVAKSRVSPTTGKHGPTSIAGKAKAAAIEEHKKRILGALPIFDKTIISQAKKGNVRAAEIGYDRALGKVKSDEATGIINPANVFAAVLAGLAAGYTISESAARAAGIPLDDPEGEGVADGQPLLGEGRDGEAGEVREE